MKLNKVRVTNFRSIRDSGEFDITDVTCLVGKNEAGKTAILQALYKLNPIVAKDGNFDLDMDYPRNEVEDYRIALEDGANEPAIVVHASYELDKNDTGELFKNFGESILNSPKLFLQKGYENCIIPKLDINEIAFVEGLIGSYELPDELNKAVIKATTIGQLKNILHQLPDSSGLMDEVESIDSDGIDCYIFSNYLESKLPKFLYFDEYYQMAGNVNIPALLRRKQDNQLLDSDKPILGLIKLARLKLEELVTPQSTETLLNKLEGASNHLSKKILQYWSQNKNIELKFDIRIGLPSDPDGFRSGNNLLGRVLNTRHKVTTPIGTRSRGFIWFFSFLAWFSTQPKTDPALILLLDEPALFLHAKAQEDMLAYIEAELKPKHQVVYTTHSPFMIDPTRFDRVRIVEDKSMEADQPLLPEMEGTKVFTDVLESNPTSIFPLQGALGYEIYQTLFIGPNSLVVEGVSDLLYIQSMSGLLERRGRIGLDKRWTITPVGGIDKVPSFIALIGAQKQMNVATLIDIKPDDCQKIEGLYKKRLLKKSHVHTYGEFISRANADVEDMFEIDFYVRLVNAEYKRELSRPIQLTDLANKPYRIVNLLEEYLVENPLSQGSFSHYRPARFFSEQVGSIEASISDETLNRFEEAFKILNALL